MFIEVVYVWFPWFSVRNCLLISSHFQTISARFCPKSSASFPAFPRISRNPWVFLTKERKLLTYICKITFTFSELTGTSTLNYVYSDSQVICVKFWLNVNMNTANTIPQFKLFLWSYCPKPRWSARKARDSSQIVPVVSRKRKAWDLPYVFSPHNSTFLLLLLASYMPRHKTFYAWHRSLDYSFWY